ncbi:hypothetical protein CEXT_136811 [Caerostris extrusa]|uniref:Uncharacterized protein n=1 Tax=Caerostris extrusa TaxID=172846 RepID=A0AAV4PJB9_CAEEX|nr:hypothetical protein CEXT_136811 [Caerostris extrusa]
MLLQLQCLTVHVHEKNTSKHNVTELLFLKATVTVWIEGVESHVAVIYYGDFPATGITCSTVPKKAIWLRRNGRPKQAAAAASEYPPTRPCPVMTGPGHDPLRYSVSAMTRAMVYDPIMRVSVVCLSYLDFIISPCQSECKNNMGVRNDLSCDWC